MPRPLKRHSLFVSGGRTFQVISQKDDLIAKFIGNCGIGDVIAIEIAQRDRYRTQSGVKELRSSKGRPIKKNYLKNTVKPCPQVSRLWTPSFALAWMRR